MPIPALPLFKHRDTVVTPADQNQFVTQFETTMDTLSNGVIPAMNDTIIDINTKTTTATTARDEAVSAKNIAVSAKDEALTAVATLQEGAIDDTTIAPNKAFSNSYIQTYYYDKDEVDTAISESALDINSLTDKPIPINTDNMVIQETGGLLKKLSWANLKNTLSSGTGFAISLTTNGYIILPSWLGGLILQWGHTGDVPGGSTATITFPISFPSSCFHVFVTGALNISTTGAVTYSLTKSNFVIKNISNNGQPYRYFAIGY